MVTTVSNMARVRATVSGSFHRAMGAIEDAVYALTDAGAEVLSPADPRVVDQFGDFLYVASDRVRAVKLVQSRHLAAIAASDFVWLVAPGGYVGQSGAMEVGYAVANGTPIFASEVPVDLTLRQYVITLPSPRDALRKVEGNSRPTAELASPPNILLDPSGTDRVRCRPAPRGDRDPAAYQLSPWPRATSPSRCCRSRTGSTLGR